MKKILILTSAVALSACFGGGDGGSGGTPVATRAAIIPGSAIATDVANSNSHITTMASEILVANDGSAHAPLIGRSATARYNGQTYTSYRLEDVDFNFSGEDAMIKFGLDANGKIISASRYKDGVISEEGVFSRSGEDSAIFEKNLYTWSFTPDSTQLATILQNKGHVPEGWEADAAANVISQHFSGGVEFTSDNSDLTAEQIGNALKDKIASRLNKTLNSQSNAAAFKNAFDDALDLYSVQVNTKVSNDDFGDPDVLNATLSIDGANSSNSTAGLKYADLGIAHVRVTNGAKVKEEVYAPYTGGYDPLEVASVADGTKFKGTVMAGIDYTKKVNDNKTKTGVQVRDNDARLTMNHDGSAVLEMDDLKLYENGERSNTDHWYNLTIEKSADGSTTFTASGSNNISTEVNSDTYVYDLPSFDDLKNSQNKMIVNFEANEYNQEENEYVRNTGSVPGTGTRLSGSFEPTVYGGISEGDLEATVRFGFGNQEYSNNNKDSDGVAIYGAFGGGLYTPPAE